MVISAINNYMNPNPIPNSQLGLDAYSEGLHLSLLEIIETMQLIQKSRTYTSTKQGNKNNYHDIIAAVVNFRKTGTQPPIISLSGPTGGHAVLGISAYRDNKGKRDMIQIYDPNYPGNDERFIEFNWNDERYYTSWHYQMPKNKHWGSEYGSPFISYVPFPVARSVWDNRGSERALSSDIMHINSGAFSVYDYSGNCVTTVHGGGGRHFTVDSLGIFHRGQ